jgi:phage tail protein X
MPITATTTATTVEKLVTRMFGKLPAARLRAATEATLAANPHLSDASNVPAGTVVVVPPLEVAEPTALREEARVSDDQIKAMAGAIAGYQEKIAERLEQRAATLGEATKLLSSSQFKRDVGAVEEATPLLTDLGATLKVERREITARRDLLAKDVSSLTEALVALARQLE